MDLVVLEDSKKSLLNVSEKVFGCNFNKSLVHQVVIAYKAGHRQGSHAQKSRAEVVGSNKKPWRQKGTGRARAGSTKSPIWRSGGVTFAAKHQSYHQKVNKKMYRGALKSILSELVRQKRLKITKNFFIEKPKTKFLLEKLKNFSLKQSLIIINHFDKNLFLAARNLYKIDICTSVNINPVSLISSKNTIVTQDAIKKIEALLI